MITLKNRTSPPSSAPAWTRTTDRRIGYPMRFPPELRAHRPTLQRPRAPVCRVRCAPRFGRVLAFGNHVWYTYVAIFWSLRMGGPGQGGKMRRTHRGNYQRKPIVQFIRVHPRASAVALPLPGRGWQEGPARQRRRISRGSQWGSMYWDRRGFWLGAAFLTPNRVQGPAAPAGGRRCGGGRQSLLPPPHPNPCSRCRTTAAQRPPPRSARWHARSGGPGARASRRGRAPGARPG